MKEDRLDRAERRLVWTNVLATMRPDEEIIFVPENLRIPVKYVRYRRYEPGTWYYGSEQSSEIQDVLDFLMEKAFGSV